MENRIKNSKRDNNVKRFLKKYRKGIIITSAGIGIASATYLGIKYIPKLNTKDAEKLINQEDTVNIVEKTLGVVKESAEVMKNTEKPLPRYLVEFKAFKTGNWYPKTRTDYIRSAYSVGACNSYGRAYRIIDTVTGEVLKEIAEDASMAACNGYPNGYPW